MDDLPTPHLRPDVPHSARIWDYFLGGRNHYPADAQAGRRIEAVFPGMPDLVRHSRAFIGRVVRHLAGEARIRQFLDIGTGLPAENNTHEVAQRIAPASRIVYVDNDPLVLVHARALLTSTPGGSTDYVDADVRDVDRILAEAGRTLDLDQPVGLLLMGILGLVEDYDEARGTVRRLTAALPPGSYLGLDDGTTTDPDYVRALARHNRGSRAVPYTPRDPEQLLGYFDGLELLDPGVVSCSRWRLDVAPFGLPDEVAAYGGLARKP